MLKYDLLDEREKRFEKLLVKTSDAELINAYADLKQSYNDVMESINKALDQINEQNKMKLLGGVIKPN